MRIVVGLGQCQKWIRTKFSGVKAFGSVFRRQLPKIDLKSIRKSRNVYRETQKQSACYGLLFSSFGPFLKFDLHGVMLAPCLFLSIYVYENIENAQRWRLSIGWLWFGMVIIALDPGNRTAVFHSPNILHSQLHSHIGVAKCCSLEKGLYRLSNNMGIFSKNLIGNAMERNSALSVC